MTTQLAVTIGLAVFQGFFGLLMTLTFALLRDVKRQIHERREEIKELRDETQRTCRECRAELKTANEKTESKLQHLHEVVSRDYVLKDDFVRIMTSVDRKLDQVVEGMGELGRVLHEHLGSEAQK